MGIEDSVLISSSVIELDDIDESKYIIFIKLCKQLPIYINILSIILSIHLYIPISDLFSKIVYI